MYPKKAIGTSHLRSYFFSCLLITGLFLIFFPSAVNAQETDTVDVNELVVNDTIGVREHSPRKAVIYSLIFPGLGQAYNKKYWKIPFIYGAGGAFLYYVNFNHTKYIKFKDALFQSKAGDRVVIDGFIYSFESLDQGRDYYRRYRDLSVAGLAAIYLLNVIDAMVDATFFHYDISDDLSMKFEPAVIQNIAMTGTTASLGFRINIGF